jgi:hypothetical protein
MESALLGAARETPGLGSVPGPCERGGVGPLGTINLSPNIPRGCISARRKQPTNPREPRPDNSIVTSYCYHYTYGPRSRFGLEVAFAAPNPVSGEFA